ncbi:MAG: lipid A deacylase LpxR family protein [Bacteroidetes bacterium]|nr:lipid A deacylase LpxR family protein [Bacteroidota bacterium]
MKKKNAGSALREQNNSNNSTLPVRSSDSLFISRLKYLRSGSIEPDLNEPVSRNYLFSPVDNRKFPSMITLSRESFLQVDFDNDILDYTDRFYTNGIRIKLISPVFQMNPLSRLTIPYRGSGTNYYGLSLVQNMFTPSTTKTGGILYGDRPYAAYLYLGSFKITNDPVKNFRQTSELDIGIIGPNSYGEWVQRSFHDAVPTNNEPLGWEYQVQNDIIVNYSISYEKGVFNGKNFDFLLSSTGNVGTLYTNFSAGGQIRTGWFNPYFANLGVAKKRALHEAGLRKTQFFFFIKGSGKLVGYDATLQGGMFNTSSSYVLPASGISRLVFQGSGGFSFSRNGIRIDLEQFILSPEFQHGWWHKWVHVALSFGI